MSAFTSVLGTITLVFYILPLLGVIFLPMIVIYSIAFVYYRKSSVETKRLESLLRSILYATYSGAPLLISCCRQSHSDTGPPETLTGLSTIRAYKRQV